MPRSACATEVCFGLTQGLLTAKMPYAITDYFGLSSTTAAYAYMSALPARELQGNNVPGPELHRRSRQPPHHGPARRTHQCASLQRVFQHGLKVVAGQRIFWCDANAGVGRYQRYQSVLPSDVFGRGKSRKTCKSSSCDHGQQAFPRRPFARRPKCYALQHLMRRILFDGL